MQEVRWICVPGKRLQGKGYANAKGAETKVFSEVFCQALPIVQAAFNALNQGALSYLWKLF